MGQNGREWEEGVFLGEYDHSLDDRGRLALPKKIRLQVSGSELVLARGFEKCILVYTRADWERETGKELELPISDGRGREIKRYLFSGAELVEIDKTGRILIPQVLQNYAGVKKEVIVLGAGDHFELWDPKTWRDYFAKQEKANQAKGA